jgi:hypothetical protein
LNKGSVLGANPHVRLFLMSGFTSASRPNLHSAIAFGLCFLALFFAIEAKLAGYVPRSDTGSQISAAKALRADAPDITSRETPAPDHSNSQVLFFFFVSIAIATFAAHEQFLKLDSFSSHLPVTSAVYFSPQVSFRPPPIQ